jgi:cell division cycle 20-like protein 1 (cofactor of APC complex)
MKLVAHKHEVCGMSFQNGMVASGSNDGAVLIWSVHNSKQFNKHRLHSGAVKAIQWCPWRGNLLATGGGSHDRKTILWNSEIEEVEHVLEGKSQVTGLAWRESSRDLVTTHSGNRRESYGMIWSSKIKEFTHILTGHNKRIVGLAISPNDQSEICTLGADETMRFWKTKRENVQEGKEGKDSNLSVVSLK